MADDEVRDPNHCRSDELRLAAQRQRTKIDFDVAAMAVALITSSLHKGSW
jgi:hypothetical protein